MEGHEKMSLATAENKMMQKNMLQDKLNVTLILHQQAAGNKHHGKPTGRKPAQHPRRTRKTGYFHEYALSKMEPRRPSMSIWSSMEPHLGACRDQVHLTTTLFCYKPQCTSIQTTLWHRFP